MSDGENKDKSFKADERFKYIGFDVFPGKAGNIFSSDEEHKTLVQKVMASFRRSEGEVRDRCTLMEERVSGMEKMFMAFVSALLLVSLFLPWFSGHFKIVTERLVPVTIAGQAQAPQGGANAAVTDSGAVAEEGTVSEDATAETVPEAVEEVVGAADEVVDSAALAAADSAAVVASQDPDYVPPGMTKIQEITSDPRSLSGIGALFALGTYGSYIFSSGFVLIISGILMIVFFISCLLFAGFNLYNLYGVKKGSSDEFALHLKKVLKFNWYPLYLWLLMLVLSFFGASYGFDSSGMIEQVGKSYSSGSFMGLHSYGIILALCAYIVLALKGKEI